MSIRLLRTILDLKGLGFIAAKDGVAVEAGGGTDAQALAFRAGDLYVPADANLSGRRSDGAARSRGGHRVGRCCWRSNNGEVGGHKALGFGCTRPHPADGAQRDEHQASGNGERAENGPEVKKRGSIRTKVHGSR